MDWTCAPEFTCTRGQDVCWLTFGGVAAGARAVLHAKVPFFKIGKTMPFNQYKGDRGFKV